MKRILVLLFVMMLSISLFASVNGERIIDVNSPIYRAVKSLYISQGHALPSTTGPWSESEIEHMLSLLDTESMSSSDKETLYYIRSELSHEEELFAFSGEINLETYLHTNPSDFVGRDMWGRDPNSTLPMILIYSDAWVGDNFYGYFGINLSNAKFQAESDAKERFASTTFSTNLLMVPPATMKTMDFSFPHKAYISAGSSNFNLIWGKFNLGWGPGESGNFILGDHLGEHNAIRATAYNNTFKYTFLVDSFTHPMNYYYYKADDPTTLEDESANNGYHGNRGTQEHLNGIRLFLSHRLEWRLFSDKLNVVLTEGLMYMSEDNYIDLNVLNPSMLWHNLYTRAHSNSILSLEVDYTLLNGFNIYGQLVVDENILPGEPIAGKAGNGPAEPSAMGYMLGATYVKQTKLGTLTLNGEAAYTDPFLYLRDGGFGEKGSDVNYRNQVKGQYGINYVVALRDIYQAGGNVQYTEEFLGYRYGGDAIVANLNAKLDNWGKWNAEANLFFMAHGTFDQWTVWTRINPSTLHPEYPTESPITPTTSHITENHKDANASSRDSIEYTFDLTLKGGYTFTEHLAISAQLDYIFVLNPGNIKSNGTSTDLQFTLSGTYSF